MCPRAGRTSRRCHLWSGRPAGATPGNLPAVRNVHHAGMTLRCRSGDGLVNSGPARVRGRPGCDKIRIRMLSSPEPALTPESSIKSDPCSGCGGMGFVCSEHPSEPMWHDACSAVGRFCGTCKRHTSVPRAPYQPSPKVAARRIHCTLCASSMPEPETRWYAAGPYICGSDGMWHSGPAVLTTADDKNAWPYCVRCALYI